MGQFEHWRFPPDYAPLILEDDVHLYPSDALMAKLHLMSKLYKEKV